MTEKDKEEKRLKPKNLREQIAYSEVFVVMANKEHVHALRDRRSEASIQARIAKEFNKPVIIVLLNELSETDKADLERFFIGYNVIKTLDLDPKDEAAFKATLIECNRLSVENMRNKVLTKTDFILIPLDPLHYYCSLVRNDIEICLEVCAGGFCVAAYDADKQLLEPKKCTNCDGYLVSLSAMLGKRSDDTWAKALEIANGIYKRYIVAKIDTEEDVAIWII